MDQTSYVQTGDPVTLKTLKHDLQRTEPAATGAERDERNEEELDLIERIQRLEERVEAHRNDTENREAEAEQKTTGDQETAREAWDDRIDELRALKAEKRRLVSEKNSIKRINEQLTAEKNSLENEQKTPLGLFTELGATVASLWKRASNDKNPDAKNHNTVDAEAEQPASTDRSKQDEEQAGTAQKSPTNAVSEDQTDDSDEMTEEQTDELDAAITDVREQLPLLETEIGRLERDNAQRESVITDLGWKHDAGLTGRIRNVVSSLSGTDQSSKSTKRIIRLSRFNDTNSSLTDGNKRATNGRETRGERGTDRSQTRMGDPSVRATDQSKQSDEANAKAPVESTTTRTQSQTQTQDDQSHETDRDGGMSL